ncbi:MAG: lipid-A-disaccharide synthase [Pirellulales bacterium]
MSESIFFSVGEPSGDLHAANLIRELRRIDPQQQFRGFGGSRVSEAGASIDFDLTQLAVVGIVEVLPKLKEFFRVADVAEEIFRTERPRAVVLVDFPGFNWHIAKRAKKFGIPVIYYLPPQLWAWGAWRLKKMRRTVDRVLCNLPFEPKWYADRGMDVEYVGHPFFDEVAERELDQTFIAQQAARAGLRVAVLPGSRTREVDKIWPMQLEVIRRLARNHPQVRFIVTPYKAHHEEACKRAMTSDDRGLNIDFVVGRTSEVIQLADCALMKSGSVSLELMARGTPAVVTYHAGRTLYAFGRCVSNLNSMTLPNIIAGRTVMPEFLAVGSTKKTIYQLTETMDRMLGDEAFRASHRDQLLELARQYAQPGAAKKAGEAIAQYLSPAKMKAA